MKQREMMPIEYDQSEMRRLSTDRRTIRMELPGLPVEGQPEPIRIKIDLDPGVVDQMNERLLSLLAQMLPAPSRPAQPS